MKLHGSFNNFDSYSKLCELAHSFKSDEKSKFEIIVSMYYETWVDEDDAENESNEIVNNCISEVINDLNNTCGKYIKNLDVKSADNSDFDYFYVDDDTAFVGLDITIFTNEILPNNLEEIFKEISMLASTDSEPDYYELYVHEI